MAYNYASESVEQLMHGPRKAYGVEAIALPKVMPMARAIELTDPIVTSLMDQVSCVTRRPAIRPAGPDARARTCTWVRPFQEATL